MTRLVLFLAGAGALAAWGAAKLWRIAGVRENLGTHIDPDKLRELGIEIP